MSWDNQSEQDLECPRGHVSKGQLKFNGGNPVWLCQATLTPEERAALPGVRSPLWVEEEVEDCRVIIRYADYDTRRNRWV